MDDNNGIILTKLRERSGKTQEQVADELDTTQSVISAHERGAKPFGRVWLERYAAYYHVSLDTIAGRQEDFVDDQKKIRHVPILGAASCGQPILAEQNIDGYIDIPAEIVPGSELAAIRIVGDSMQGARLLDGDLAIIRLQDYVEDGEIALICIGENAEEGTIKRVRYSDGYISLNPVPVESRLEEFESYSLPATKVRIVGKIAGVWWG